MHGMGRTPLSGWRMLRHLQQAGVQPATFGYLASVETFARIAQRLTARVAALAARGDYILIGHSLGGVLLRAAVNALPAGTRGPAHVFLLGSPVRASRLACRLRRHVLYRLLTGDCGQLLASRERMSALAPLGVRATAIAGTRALGHALFDGEANDGIVSLSEVSADWLGAPLLVPVVHALLPSSRRVAGLVLACLSRQEPPDAWHRSPGGAAGHGRRHGLGTD